MRSKSYLRVGSSNPADMPNQDLFLTERGVKTEFDCPATGRRCSVQEEFGIESIPRDLTVWSNEAWHAMSETERQDAVNEAREREVEVLHLAAVHSGASDAHKFLKTV